MIDDSFGRPRPPTMVLSSVQARPDPALLLSPDESVVYGAVDVANIRLGQAWKFMTYLAHRLSDDEIVALVRAKSYRAPLPAHASLGSPLPSEIGEATSTHSSTQGTGAPSGAYARRPMLRSHRSNFPAPARLPEVSGVFAEGLERRWSEEPPKFGALRVAGTK